MKKTNKGFSMVELIIVIAIMAILAGALAPALIKYINKSRLSSDIQTGQTIAKAMQTALANEEIFDDAADVNKVTTSKLSGTKFKNEVTEGCGGTLPSTGKSKKDLSGAAIDKTFYVSLSTTTSSCQVWYGATDNDHMVYPNVGACMSK